MFSNQFPFLNEGEIMSEDKVKFIPKRKWDSIASVALAQRMIQKMLEKQEAERYSIDEVLADEWLTNDAGVIAKVDELIGPALDTNDPDADADDDNKENVQSNENQSSTFPKVSRKKCFRCQKSFSGEVMLIKHLKSDHNIKVVETKRHRHDDSKDQDIAPSKLPRI